MSSTKTPTNLSKEGEKNLIRQAHKHSYSISHSEWYHEEFVMPILGTKSSFRNVLRFYPHLVVPQEKINL